MNFHKVKTVCRIVRIIVGLGLIATGVITGIYWFYLGALPFIAGVANFCPLCIVTKRCALPEPVEKIDESN